MHSLPVYGVMDGTGNREFRSLNPCERQCLPTEREGFQFRRLVPTLRITNPVCVGARRIVAKLRDGSHRLGYWG